VDGCVGVGVFADVPGVEGVAVDPVVVGGVECIIVGLAFYGYP